MNESGQLCTDQRFASGGGGKACNFWFKLGDEYYAASADAQDQATVRRTLSR